MTIRTMLTIALLGAAAPALAQEALPHDFAPGAPARAAHVNDNFAWLAARDARVIWKKSPTCDVPACAMTASSLTWPNNSDYTVVASLDLPAGSWLLTGKLATYAKSDVRHGDLECALGVPGGEQDYSSVGLAPAVGGGRTLSLHLPVVTTAAATTVRLGCKLWGVNTDDTTPIAAEVWGAKLFALRVASIVQQ